MQPRIHLRSGAALLGDLAELRAREADGLHLVEVRVEPERDFQDGPLRQVVEERVHNFERAGLRAKTAWFSMKFYSKGVGTVQEGTIL